MRQLTIPELVQIAERRRCCICFDVRPLLPLRTSDRLRPSRFCPLHKTLAERWDSIKSWDDFNDALNADKLPDEPRSTLP